MSTVSVAQNYGAILLGGLLAFRYVVSLYHRFTTYLLAACPDVLTCSSSHTGDYILASPIVLSHWCGNYPSVFCTFWSNTTGHCNVVCSCPRVCEVNINIFLGFLTCAIPHLSPLPSGILSSSPTVISIWLTGFLGVSVFITCYERGPDTP